MQLKGLSSQFPAKIITNLDILHEIEKNSKQLTASELKEALRISEIYLEKTTSIERRWTRDSKELRDLTVSAMQQSLEEADVDPLDIDVVIHASVFKVFKEPGDAHFCAEAAGMLNAKCFDIRDACNSWTTAAMLLQDLMKAGRYKNGLIISTEFPMMDGAGSRPNCFNLRSVEEIGWKFPVQTLGDAVTSSVFTNEGEDWNFITRSDPTLAGLCFVPTHASKEYLKHCQYTTPVDYHEGTCVSFGKLLHEKGMAPTVAAFSEFQKLVPNSEIVIPHSSGKKAWIRYASKADVLDYTHFVYPQYGNVVSCSFPVGLQDARTKGLVDIDTQVAGWITAAGGSAIAFGFKSVLGSLATEEDQDIAS